MCYLLTSSLALAGDEERIVLPWMCLEDCQEDIEADLQQMIQLAQKGILTTISYPHLDVGDNATIIFNPVTDMAPRLAPYFKEIYPAIATFSVPRMRGLWSNATKMDAWIDQAVKIALSEKVVAGFNIDFEPNDGHFKVTKADGLNYVRFIELFAEKLHQVGLKLSVDVAGWSPLWQNGLMANETTADFLINMDLYGTDLKNDQQWWDIFDKYMVTVPDHLRGGVGLATVNDTTKLPTTAQEVRPHLAACSRAGIKYVGVWDAPFPEDWIPVIDDWVHKRF